MVDVFIGRGVWHLGRVIVSVFLAGVGGFVFLVRFLAGSGLLTAFLDQFARFYLRF